VPEEQVVMEGIETGVVVWDQGVVTVDGVGLQGTPQVVGGEQMTD